MIDAAITFVVCFFVFVAKNEFSKDVDFEELARCTDDFNGAQCKAVCVEAVSRFLLHIYCALCACLC